MKLTKKQDGHVGELRDALKYALDNLDDAIIAADDTAPTYLDEVDGWIDAARDSFDVLAKALRPKREGKTKTT